MLSFTNYDTACLHFVSKLYVFHSFCEKYFYTKFHTTAFCILKVILKERLPYYGNTASLLDSLSMAGSFDFVLLLYHPSFGMIHMNFFDLCLTWLYFGSALSYKSTCSDVCWLQSAERCRRQTGIATVHWL